MIDQRRVVGNVGKKSAGLPYKKRENESKHDKETRSCETAGDEAAQRTERVLRLKSGTNWDARSRSGPEHTHNSAHSTRPADFAGQKV